MLSSFSSNFPQVYGAKGRTELAPCPSLRWAVEPESGRAGVVPWRCESSGQEPSPKGSPDKGLCSVLQRTSSNLQGLPWESWKLPLPGWGHEGPPAWSRSSSLWATIAQRSPVKGLAHCCRGRQKTPGDTRRPCVGEKKPSPPSCRTRGATFMVHEQQAVTQPEWTRGALTSGSARCSEEGKKPPGPVPICRGGKFLPDPSTGDRLSLSM